MRHTVWLIAQVASDEGPGALARGGALAALLIFIAASVWLGRLAQQVVERSRFIQGYFQGNRGLGAWTIALTATVQSGGTFMGFPSLVYTHGWIVALWIGSYMVVPLTGFAVIGKRIAQISRMSGSVTMPDLFRARFASPTAGLVCSLSIISFMTIMMFAQFKAGAVVMKSAWPGSGGLVTEEAALRAAASPGGAKEASAGGGLRRWLAGTDPIYLLGLAIFSLTVVGYTLIGGFLAAVWTDLLQSVMMFVGVMILLFLALGATGGLERASRQAVTNVEQVAAQRLATQAGGTLSSEERAQQAHFRASQYAAGPGLRSDGTPFLPLSMAFSMFCFWPYAGLASPASVVRIMACKNTSVLRKSIFLLALYNMGIYLPLIVICICARALVPDLAHPDEVVPRMALQLTGRIPFQLGSLVSGLILAAPFGAIMATVSCYLLVIASGLVRDVYQRFIDPQAPEHALRRLTWWVMLLIGAVAVAVSIYPVKYLQTLVVFSSGCSAASFLVPTLMLCYWRRATAAGTISAMLAGAATALALNLAGLVIAFREGRPSEFHAYELLGLEPLIWGVLVSLVVGVVVSLLTEPPEARLVRKFFDAPASQEAMPHDVVATPAGASAAPG
jgi:SSS family solute:Na+ symporter/sodium/pantothenate symporter